MFPSLWDYRCFVQERLEGVRRFPCNGRVSLILGALGGVKTWLCNKTMASVAAAVAKSLWGLQPQQQQRDNVA